MSLFRRFVQLVTILKKKLYLKEKLVLKLAVNQSFLSFIIIIFYFFDLIFNHIF